jgi:hypothetical protein
MDAQYLASLSMAQLDAQVGGLAPARVMVMPVGDLFADVIGTCESCGQRTSDWWWYSGATGTCECHACYERA